MRRGAATCSTNRTSSAVEVLRPQPRRAPRPARASICVFERRVRQHARCISAATARGSRDRIEHAAAVHRRRHGRGGIGEHRHALVERLDDRHAEAFVLARAQKQIGDVVERRQLLVGDLAEDVHVAHAEPRDERVQLRAGTPRSRRTSRRGSAARAGCRASGTRGRTGSDRPAACSGSRGRRTGCSSTRRRTPRGRADRARRRDARSPARPAARPVGEKPSASSSWRLNSESPSARSHARRDTPAARGGRDSTAATSCSWTPRKYSGGVMLW